PTLEEVLLFLRAVHHRSGRDSDLPSTTIGETPDTPPPPDPAVIRFGSSTRRPRPSASDLLRRDPSRPPSNICDRTTPKLIGETHVEWRFGAERRIPYGLVASWDF